MLFLANGMVKQDLVSGVVGLVGVVWVSIASSSDRCKVDSQCGSCTTIAMHSPLVLQCIRSGM